MMVVAPAHAEIKARAAQDASLGLAAPDVWIAAGGTDRSPIDGAISLMLTGEPAQLRALAARAWPLDATADAYARFIAVFEPLHLALKADLALTDLDALLARTLLIHAWRRIVLRDPLLPPEVLPFDWPGTPARTLCASIYRRLLSSSERWLDENAIGNDGERLRANPGVVGARFRD